MGSFIFTILAVISGFAAVVFGVAGNREPEEGFNLAALVALFGSIVLAFIAGRWSL